MSEARRTRAVFPLCAHKRCRLLAGLLLAGAMLAGCQNQAVPRPAGAAAASPAMTRAEKLALGEQLRQAARRGDALEVRRLLAQGAPVNAQDEQGNSPLLLATAGNHVEVARSLLLDGADPNLRNAQQDSAYLLAGAQGRLEIVRMAISYGADLRSTNRYGGTALIPACERGHVETVQALIAAGVDINHVNRLGWTCLLEAIVLGDGGPRQQAVVRELIAAGADLNLADKEGVSPLAHARRRGQSEIARLLQTAGAR